MSKKEYEEYLKDFRKHTKSVTSSKENAKEFLIRAGINTKTGRLTKFYKNTKSHK